MKPNVREMLTKLSFIDAKQAAQDQDALITVRTVTYEVFLCLWNGKHTKLYGVVISLLSHSETSLTSSNIISDKGQ